LVQVDVARDVSGVIHLRTEFFKLPLGLTREILRPRRDHDEFYLGPRLIEDVLNLGKAICDRSAESAPVTIYDAPDTADELHHATLADPSVGSLGPLALDEYEGRAIRSVRDSVNTAIFPVIGD